MTILGPDEGDQLGHAGAAGDFDGDGSDDLLLGAVSADGFDNGINIAGEAYLILGGPSPAATVDTLLGEATLRIYGGDAVDRLGRSVAVGDLNGDGVSDLLIAATGGDVADGSQENAGEVQVIFGRAGLQGVLDLARHSTDLVVQGMDAHDALGHNSFGKPSLLAADADGDVPADETPATEAEFSTDSDAESAEVEAASSDEEAEPAAEEDAETEPIRHEGMDWYVLRVASNKEEQVRTALERKVKIEALEHQIGQILVPTVKEKRMRGRQARVYNRKLYPGYVIVEMATEKDGSIPEDIWFMIKETTGVGDFIGSDGKPIKMEEHEVNAILAVALKSEEDVGLSGMRFEKGDLAKVTEGSFENFEGMIDSVDESRGMVTVLLTIFGRSTPVEVEYWQVEKL